MKIAVVMNLDWPLKRYHKMFAGIKAYAAKNTQWNISWDPYPELKLSKEPSFYRGIIGRCEFDTVRTARKFNTPIVNTWYSNELTDLVSVFPNYFKAGQQAALTMRKKGYTNFLSVNYDDKAAKEFLRGVKSVIELKKYSHREYLMPRDLEKSKESWNNVKSDFPNFIKNCELPLAVITGNSDLGPKISALCSENDIKIPEDAALISSDNDLSYCEGFSPSISSVDIDYFDVGFQAAKVLDHKVKGLTVPEKTLLIDPVGVIHRDSTVHLVLQDNLVKKALNFISKNYHKNIQICDVVKNFHISRRSLEHRFKKAVGHTIHEEISKLRLETTKLLLTDSSKSIKAISQKAGYTSDCNMRRTFKMHTGMPPQEYRVKFKERI